MERLILGLIAGWALFAVFGGSYFEFGYIILGLCLTFYALGLKVLNGITR